MSKKYMIRCDIEGVSGVVSYEQAEPGKAEYAYGHRMFMGDLLALLEGLDKAGADEVVIYDEHYYGRNIDVEKLPDGVEVICGKPPYREDWAGGLDETFAGVILLGFHSKAGTLRGLLNHSYELDICDLRLNGVSVGEIGMESAIAGDYGVPVVMMSGDSAGVAEANELLPGIRGVIVKESLCEFGGRCYAATVTRERIRQGAMELIADPPTVEPYRVQGDVCLEVELADGNYLFAMRELNADRMKDEHTLVINGSNATAVWADYWQKKLHVQAMLKDNA